MTKMNKELIAYSKRHSLEEYLRYDDEIIKTLNYRVPDLPGEEWRPVKDFELYEVSNYGRVKRPLQERCYRDGGYPVLFAEKLLSPGYTKGGYAYVMFSIFGRTKTFLVHRLVADAFELPYESPDQTEVHHIDGNPRNNRLENLKRCTPYENKQFNNRGKKVSEGRKAYLAGLSEEERKAMSERAYKKCMRKISCGGKIYDCLKDFAEAIGVTPAAVHHWLNGYNPMPAKYAKLELRYV